MCASIREFGFAVAMLCRSTGEIVDGHLRFKGARKLGLPELPVVLCDHWTEAQVKAFRLMVNRSVAWAEWDDDLLGPELLDLKAMDFDLKLTGFDDDGAARLLQPDMLWDSPTKTPFPSFRNACLGSGRSLDPRESQTPRRRRDRSGRRWQVDGGGRRGPRFHGSSV